MKFRAFTLLELMVGIIISGFVIGTAYGVLMFSNQHFNKARSIKTAMLSHYEFTAILYGDLETASKIFKESDA